MSGSFQTVIEEGTELPDHLGWAEEEIKKEAKEEREVRGGGRIPYEVEREASTENLRKGI